MITVLSMMLISISMLSGLIYIIMQMQSNIGQSFAIDYNKKQLEFVTKQLASKVLRNGNDYIVPLGQNKDGRYTLPKWVSKGNDITINGDKFTYCPTVKSSNVLTSNDQINTKLGTYGVHSKVKAENANIPFIYNSELNLNDTIAVIISPIGSNYEAPSCEDVKYLNGKYYAKGGQVSALTENNIEKYGNLFNKDKVVYIDSANIPNENENLNDGDFDTKTLELQANIFKNNNEKELTIFLKNDIYEISDINTFVSNNNIHKKLTIIGEDVNQTFIKLKNNPTTPIEFNLKNTDITLKNVSITANLNLKDNNLKLSYSSINSLNINNSKADITESYISQDIITQNSNISLNNEIRFNKLIANNSKIFLDGKIKTNLFNIKNTKFSTKIDVSNEHNLIESTDFIINNGTEANINSTKLQLNRIDNYGNLTIQSSEVKTSGFSLRINNYNNSILHIEDSFNDTSSSSVEVAERSNQRMSLVSGTNSRVAGCVGEIFNKEYEIKADSLTSTSFIKVTKPKENNKQNWDGCKIDRIEEKKTIPTQ